MNDLLDIGDEDIIHVRQLGDLTFMQILHVTEVRTQYFSSNNPISKSWIDQHNLRNSIRSKISGICSKLSSMNVSYTDLCCSLSKSQRAIDKYDDILRQVWSELNPTIVSNLIRFMPGRVQAVIAANGGAIRYSFGWIDSGNVEESPVSDPVVDDSGESNKSHLQ